MTTKTTRTGGCLCGAVTFEVDAPKPRFTMCHCGMCRKWSAGPFMSVHCPGPANFTNTQGLAWYRGSKWGERGFCSVCGTSLFWRLAENPDEILVVSSEAFDDPDDLTLERHIYSDAKPARYNFADDTPRVTEAEFLEEMGVTSLDNL